MRHRQVGAPGQILGTSPSWHLKDVQSPWRGGTGILVGGIILSLSHETEIGHSICSLVALIAETRRFPPAGGNHTAGADHLWVRSNF